MPTELVGAFIAYAECDGRRIPLTRYELRARVQLADALLVLQRAQRGDGLEVTGESREMHFFGTIMKDVTLVKV